MNRLQIIDSTTVTLFSNMLFKGVGRHPKTGKKKGGIKVHTNIHANKGIPSDVRFTSAATNDSFMLKHFFGNEFDPKDSPEYIKCFGMFKFGREYMLSSQNLVSFPHARAMAFRAAILPFRTF